MPETSEATFEITNEEEAIGILQRLLNREIPEDTPISVVFRDWPTIDVHLPRTPIRASISPTMMEAFIETQTALYRSYSLLTTDSGDLRGLTRAEKEALEFRVRVQGGSSEYSAGLGKVLDVIGTNAVNHMTPSETFVCVIVIALLIAGVTSFKSWLKSRAEQRKDETHNEQTKAFLAAQADILTHDEKMVTLIKEAIRQQPILDDIEAATEPAKQSLVRAVGEEWGGTIQGVAITHRFASEINAQKRQQSVVETLRGVFRVAKVDTTTPEGFRVTFSSVENDTEISASLEDAILSEHHKERIQRAEWNKQPIIVTFRVRRLRNKYVEATIIDVDDIPNAARVAQ
jgi:hypothetical protein